MRRSSNQIPKLHVKKDDTVMIIAGKDKGKTGRIIKVIPESRRVLIDGLNIVKKHTKPTAENTDGGIVEMEASLHISNVMLWDEKSKKVTRVGRTVKVVDGKKTYTRISIRTKQEIK